MGFFTSTQAKFFLPHGGIFTIETVIRMKPDCDGITREDDDDDDDDDGGDDDDPHHIKQL